MRRISLVRILLVIVLRVTILIIRVSLVRILLVHITSAIRVLVRPLPGRIIMGLRTRSRIRSWNRLPEHRLVVGLIIPAIEPTIRIFIRRRGLGAIKRLLILRIIPQGQLAEIFVTSKRRSDREKSRDNRRRRRRRRTRRVDEERPGVEGNRDTSLWRSVILLIRRRLIHSVFHCAPGFCFGTSRFDRG